MVGHQLLGARLQRRADRAILRSMPEMPCLLSSGSHPRHEIAQMLLGHRAHGGLDGRLCCRLTMACNCGTAAPLCPRNTIGCRMKHELTCLYLSYILKCVGW